MPSGPPRRSSHYYERERSRGRFYSAVMHLLFLVLAITGLPSFLMPTPPEEPVVISVEILPISAMSNVKPSETPPAQDVKPEEKKPDQAKPSPPVKTADSATPPPPQDKPSEKKEVKPEPKKEKPPEPKKEVKKQKPKEDDLAAVLKAVKETAQKEKKEDKPKKETKEDTSPTKSMSSKYNSDMPMSMSERDAIMSQLAKCWTVPAGAKDAQNLVITIDAEYSNDGSYIRVALAPESLSRYNSDSFFRAAADSAIRAVKECSPLRNLPPEKYETWRSMELRFDPKFMLN